jgi:hypothetical protein
MQEVINMELSPLAREKLAKIGDLTQEEKARLQYSEQLNSLLSDYFRRYLSPEDLCRELKKQKEEAREFMIREAQFRLLDTISLSSSEIDFERQRGGILAVEALKAEGNYTNVELNLNSIESLLRQYREEIEKAYSTIKAHVERQVKQAAQQLAAQAGRRGATVDIRGSVEAATMSSPEWKNFISRHENTYSQKLRDHLVKLREML